MKCILINMQGISFLFYLILMFLLDAIDADRALAMTKIRASTVEKNLLKSSSSSKSTSASSNKQISEFMKDKQNFQGSVLFNFPKDNIFPVEKINLNVYNNFLITNSNISQTLNGNLGNSISNKTQEVKMPSKSDDYIKKIKDLNEKILKQLILDKNQIVIEKLKSLENLLATKSEINLNRTEKHASNNLKSEIPLTNSSDNNKTDNFKNNNNKNEIDEINSKNIAANNSSNIDSKAINEDFPSNNVSPNNRTNDEINSKNNKNFNIGVNNSKNSENIKENEKNNSKNSVNKSKISEVKDEENNNKHEISHNSSNNSSLAVNNTSIESINSKENSNNKDINADINTQNSKSNEKSQETSNDSSENNIAENDQENLATMVIKEKPEKDLESPIIYGKNSDKISSQNEDEFKPNAENEEGQVDDIKQSKTNNKNPDNILSNSNKEITFITAKLVDKIGEDDSIEVFPISNMAVNKNDEKGFQESLLCLNQDSEEYKHFTLNSEQCKKLNFLYLSILPIMKVSESNLNEVNCRGNTCQFDILIKFKSESTDFILYLNTSTKPLSIRSFTVSPAIYSIPIDDKKFEDLDKQELFDLIMVYTYQNLMKLLILIPGNSQYNIVITAEGEYFTNFNDDNKKRFIRAILSLQTVDDRFIIDWSNVRIINKNEKKIQDFVVMKNLLDKSGSSSADTNVANKNIVSLNFGNDGLNLIGLNSNNKGDVVPSKTGSSLNMDSLLNPADSSSNSIQIQSGGEKQNLYQKEIKIKGISNIEDEFISALSGNGVSNRISLEESNDNYLRNNNRIFPFPSDENKDEINNSFHDYYNKPFFKSIDNEKPEDTQKESNYNSSKLKVSDYVYKKFLNDPTVLKFQNILKDSDTFNHYLKQQKDLNKQNLIQSDDVINYNKTNTTTYKSKIKNINSTNFNMKNFRFSQSQEIKKKTKDNFKNTEIKPNIQPTPNMISINQTLKYEEDNIKYNRHPCFNIGYLDNNLKLIGSGNYTECYSLIKYNLNQEKFNKTQFLKNLNKNLTEIILDTEFKNFKFLLNGKENENNLQTENNNNNFNRENMEYSQLKYKIQNVCSQKFSQIIAEYSKFKSNNLHKLCFDLTYLTYLMDQNEIQGNNFFIPKTHSTKDFMKIPNTQIFDILLSDKIRGVFYIFILLTVILNAWVLFQHKLKKSLINFLIGISENDFKLNEITILQFLTYNKVKTYLFYEEDSYFIKKYGKDFRFEENLRKNKKSIIKEIKELYQEDAGLRKIFQDCKIFFMEFKISMAIYLITIILVILLLTNTIILLVGIHNLNKNDNCLLNSSTLIVISITIFSSLIAAGVGIKIKNSENIEEKLNNDSIILLS